MTFLIIVYISFHFFSKTLQIYIQISTTYSTSTYAGSRILKNTEDEWAAKNTEDEWAAKNTEDEWAAKNTEDEWGEWSEYSIDEWGEWSEYSTILAIIHTIWNHIIQGVRRLWLQMMLFYVSFIWFGVLLLIVPKVDIGCKLVQIEPIYRWNVIKIMHICSLNSTITT